MKPRASLHSSKQSPDPLHDDKVVLVTDSHLNPAASDRGIGVQSRLSHTAQKRKLKCFASFCFYFGIFGAGVFTALSVVAYYGMSTECYFICADEHEKAYRGSMPSSESADSINDASHQPMDFIVGAPPLADLHNLADNCVFSIVESIPQNLTFPEGEPAHPSTYSGLKKLIASAKQSINIASFYWTLQGDDIAFHDNSAAEGEDIFRSLQELGQRHVSLRIVQNAENNDTAVLSEKARAEGGDVEVRTVNFTRLMGKGILHTKFWLVDDQHFYIGSANLDWRSLTQVKELGVLVENCPSLGTDLKNIFDVYWYLGDPKNVIPNTWPANYSTNINLKNPINVRFNGTTAPVYLSSSPEEFCPEGRTWDLDAILDVIDSARQFIYIAVMDYSPTSLYLPKNRYWPVIDDALKKAAFERKVKVHLLASKWNHTNANMYPLLCSLSMVGHIHHPHTDLKVQLFEVPSFTANQSQIPYSRVNHNKYMVTDQHAFIGTSNWSEDYFGWTGGVGIIIQQNSTDNHGNLRQQLQDIFNRDWNSNFTQPLYCNNHSD